MTETPTGAGERLQEAVAHHLAGRYGEAERLYREVLGEIGDNPPILDNLALAMQQQGRVDEAIRCFQRAVALDPTLANAWNNLGIALRARGRHDEGLAACRRATECRPDWAVAFSNLGVALLQVGHFDEAIGACRRALELDPAFALAAGNLGTALRELGRFDEAEAVHRRAVELKPDDPDGWFRLGGTLQLAGKRGDAVEAYQRVVALDPRHAGTLYNFGFLLKDLGHLGDAIAMHREVLRIDPENHLAREQLLFEMRHACEWRDVAPIRGAADRAVAEGRFAAPPFIMLARAAPKELHRPNAVAWSAQQLRNVPRYTHDPRARAQKAPLVIGYLSFDFRDHPMAHLIGRLFGLHDRASVRVHAYSYGPDDGSAWRRRLVEGCDEFVRLEQLDDVQAAQRIHDDGCDILIDLAGWTQGSRLGICARRPAPVQMTYLGLPSTTGAACFDYVLVDSVLAPPGDEGLFSEALVRMPHSYLVTDAEPEVAPDRFSRRELGLPETGIVFASFNQPYKIEPEMFDVWARILAQVPGSVLWQLSGNDLAHENLRREAAARGIDPGRLIFAPMWPKARHLARLQAADMVLDTRSYCGHTSTSDALSVGVPVIAGRGEHFASRVSASCLAALGVPELITADLAAYEALALRLAREPATLAALKAELAANRRTYPLFDTARFTRDVERAYAEMWRRYQAGEAPRALTLAA